MSHYLECALCGIEGPQIRPVLVEWADPALAARRFTTIPRCIDAVTCRARVLQAGEPWPLTETQRLSEEIAR